jgi:hypothetical protein
MLLPSTCCRPVVKRRAPVRPYSVQARAVACWSPRPASFLAGGRAPGPPPAACARCQQTFRLARPDLAGRALTITRQLLAWIAFPARRQGGPSILTAHDYLRAGYHGRTGGGGAGTQRDTVHQQTPFKLTHPPSPRLIINGRSSHRSFRPSPVLLAVVSVFSLLDYLDLVKQVEATGS